MIEENVDFVQAFVESSTKTLQELEASKATDFDESALRELTKEELAELDIMVEKTTLDMTKDYGEPDYLLYQNGVGFMPRGDFQALKAEAKNGKSMLMDFFMGTMLKADGKYGCLECPTPGLKILYIDTEMQERNTALQSKRVHTICGLPVYENMPNFNILTLRGQGEVMCKKIVERKIQLFRPDAVFVDGIKDLCENFNDLTESAKLVRWEMNISKLYNCALMSILHVNPNSDKMRGHLGTEEQNKCSDVFTVIKKKNEGGSEVYFKVKQTAARNRDIEDFEFECQGTYGTPVQRGMIGEMIPTYTVMSTVNKREVTIDLIKADMETVTNFLEHYLNGGHEAPCESALRNTLRKALPSMSMSEPIADAWVKWALENEIILKAKGAHNSNIIRWNDVHVQTVIDLTSGETVEGEEENKAPF